MSKLTEALQPELYGLPFQPHSATSKAAAKSFAAKAPSLKQQVLDFFKSRPDGATDEQLINHFGLSASSVRPRRVDLVDDELLIDSGRTAKGRSGRDATVWICKPAHPFSTLMPPL